MTEVNRARCASRALFAVVFCLACSRSGVVANAMLGFIGVVPPSADTALYRTRPKLAEVALSCGPSVVIGLAIFAATVASMPLFDSLVFSLALPVAPLLVLVSPFAAWHGVRRILKGRAVSEITAGHVRDIAISTGGKWHAALCGIYTTGFVLMSLNMPDVLRAAIFALSVLTYGFVIQVILWVCCTLPLSIAGAALFNRFARLSAQKSPGREAGALNSSGSG